MAVLDRTRLFAIARKEAIQLRRDPRSLMLAFLLPVLLLVLFGYAITWDIKDITTAVVDQDHTQQSRDLIGTFTASGYFRVTRRLDRSAQVDAAFNRGDAEIAIVIPPRFAADLGAGRPAPLQLLVDGADANTATIAISYARAVVQSWAARALPGVAQLTIPIRAESRVWYNEELVSRNMIVPGLVVTIMAVLAALLTSLTIAREWERGTMEQLASTPVSGLEVIIGKLIPYLVIGMVDVAMVTVLGILIFGVPFRGSVLLLAGGSFLFLVGALGFGTYISAVTKSQLLASQMGMMLTYLPTVLLSGFMFAISAMPIPLQAISFLVPARYFLVVTRGVFLKGVGVEVLWVQGLLMIVYAALGLGLAVHAFRKELE